jgi:hypothetical protein
MENTKMLKALEALNSQLISSVNKQTQLDGTFMQYQVESLTKTVQTNSLKTSSIEKISANLTLIKSALISCQTTALEITQEICGSTEGSIS